MGELFRSHRWKYFRRLAVIGTGLPPTSDEYQYRGFFFWQNRLDVDAAVPFPTGTAWNGGRRPLPSDVRPFWRSSKCAGLDVARL